MRKYKVYGTTTVSVVKEVWASNEDEALDKAYQMLPTLTSYCGNGGYDKLVGVEESDECVEAFDDIEYDDCKVIEDDPDYFECPECGEECERRTDSDGVEYWWCNGCCRACDDDGDEVWPDEDLEEE